MKEVIKSIAVNVGIGVPCLTFLYFSNPTLMNSLNNMEMLSLCLGIAICKELEEKGQYKNWGDMSEKDKADFFK